MGALQKDKLPDFIWTLFSWLNFMRIYFFLQQICVFSLFYSVPQNLLYGFSLSRYREINNLRTVRIFTLTFIALYFTDKKKLIQYAYQPFEHKETLYEHNVSHCRKHSSLMSGFGGTQIERKIWSIMKFKIQFISCISSELPCGNKISNLSFIGE